MPQFVVLDHDWPEPHHDLLLENGASLLAFRLPKWPGESACVPVRRLFDHRLIYLTYEGQISGGRGTVRRQLAGQWDLRKQLAQYWELGFTTPSMVWSGRLIGMAASWLSPIRRDSHSTAEGGQGELWLSPWSFPAGDEGSTQDGRMLSPMDPGDG
jgi:hypothetical protein